MGYITEDVLSENLAAYFKMSYKKLLYKDVDIDTVKRFPKELVLKSGLLPFHVNEKKVWVAVSDPLSNERFGDIKRIYDKDIKLFLCAHSRIIKIASKAYEDKEKIKRGMDFLTVLNKDHS